MRVQEALQRPLTTNRLHFSRLVLLVLSSIATFTLLILRLPVTDTASFHSRNSSSTVKYHRPAVIPLAYNPETDLSPLEKSLQKSLQTFLSTLDAFPSNPILAPTTTGITILGNPNSPQLSTIISLRLSNCQLPIEFAHIDTERVPATTIALLTSLNVSIRAFPAPPTTTPWSLKNIKRGAAKPTAILTSPFTRVLFLDPDVLILQDPSHLFTTPQFTRTGALFWPDYRSTPPTNKIYALMGFTYATSEREWESGIVVVDKSREAVWKGLVVAEWICVRAHVFFEMVWGDKEAFRWGFGVVARRWGGVEVGGVRKLQEGGVSLEDVFYVNQRDPHPVGVVEKVKNRNMEAARLHDKGAETNASFTTENVFHFPAGTIFCGHSFLQWNVAGTHPLLLHMTRLKTYANRMEKPFHVAQEYVPVGNTNSWEVMGTRCEFVDGLKAEQCCRLGGVEGMEVRTYGEFFFSSENASLPLIEREF
ncbi:hypothetical protein HDU98_002362 [Podochytrium sp. JEL0797]|nr:hypothetical protein HDU98_002362 [Podochytrium sp. JEL0797]